MREKVNRCKESTEIGDASPALHKPPRRPYCSNSKRIGKILGKQRAIRFRCIQINHPHLVRYLVFDLDYEGSAFAHEEAGLPPPTLIVVNRLNAHSYLVYEIDPVYLKTATKKKKKLLIKVLSVFKEVLRADRVITTQKMLVKNPFHRDWEIIETGRVYELRDLIREVRFRPAKTMRQKDPKTAHSLIDPSSRNVTLFNIAMFYAYE